MSEQKFQYLFTFRPLDAFSFSGETSAKTRSLMKDGESTDAFLRQATHAARRQAFRVETDMMPPQTTMMGAVRRMLVEGGMEIGGSSFNISAEEKQDMGDIVQISPVFLMGEDRMGKTKLCIPAPTGVAMDGDYKSDGGEYTPAVPQWYKAKEDTMQGWFVYDEDDVTAEPAYWTGDKLFITYTQALVHVGGAALADSYHLQCKCRFQDRVLNKDDRMTAEDKEQLLTDLRFCTIATLSKECTQTNSLLLSLGSKDSRFLGECSKTTLDLSNLAVRNSTKQTEAGKEYYWCVSLLSAARLPENWRKQYSLVQGFVKTRNIRCATSDKAYRLQLISQKYVFAEKGSVFLFASEDKQKEFAAAIKGVNGGNLAIGGLNQALCYTVQKPSVKSK